MKKKKKKSDENIRSTPRRNWEERTCWWVDSLV